MQIIEIGFAVQGYKELVRKVLENHHIAEFLCFHQRFWIRLEIIITPLDSD